MVKYDIDKKHAYFNQFTFTRDNKTGYFLSSKKIDNKRKRLHVYIWECNNGKIPDGYEIHHKDENKFNNEIENLEMLTSKNHSKIHAENFKNDIERVAKAKENLIKNLIPKAIEWHKSKSGREWHKEHYEKHKNKLHIIEEYTCLYCGKKFKTLKGNNKFCSNNCKSAWRRKQGTDNIIKTCAICGKSFEGNKYAKSKTCSIECGRKQRIQTMQNKEHKESRKG